MSNLTLVSLQVSDIHFLQDLLEECIHEVPLDPQISRIKEELASALANPSYVALKLEEQEEAIHHLRGTIRRQRVVSSE